MGAIPSLVLTSASAPIFAVPVLQAKADIEVPRAFGYLISGLPAAVVVDWFSLRKWAHTSVGQMAFGLVEIRGRDGAWPGWRELLGDSGRYREGVPSIVRVRRCDVRDRDRRSVHR